MNINYSKIKINISDENQIKKSSVDTKLLLKSTNNIIKLSADNVHQFTYQCNDICNILFGPQSIDNLESNINNIKYSLDKIKIIYNDNIKVKLPNYEMKYSYYFNLIFKKETTDKVLHMFIPIINRSNSEQIYNSDIEKLLKNNQDISVNIYNCMFPENHEFYYIESDDNINSFILFKNNKVIEQKYYYEIVNKLYKTDNYENLIIKDGIVYESTYKNCFNNDIKIPDELLNTLNKEQINQFEKFKEKLNNTLKENLDIKQVDSDITKNNFNPFTLLINILLIICLFPSIFSGFINNLVLFGRTSSNNNNFYSKLTIFIILFIVTIILSISYTWSFVLIFGILISLQIGFSIINKFTIKNINFVYQILLLLAVGFILPPGLSLFSKMFSEIKFIENNSFSFLNCGLFVLFIIGFYFIKNNNLTTYQNLQKVIPFIVGLLLFIIAWCFGVQSNNFTENLLNQESATGMWLWIIFYIVSSIIIYYLLGNSNNYETIIIWFIFSILLFMCDTSNLLKYNFGTSGFYTGNRNWFIIPYYCIIIFLMIISTTNLKISVEQGFNFSKIILGDDDKKNKILKGFIITLLSFGLLFNFQKLNDSTSIKIVELDNNLKDEEITKIIKFFNNDKEHNSQYIEYNNKFDSKINNDFDKITYDNNDSTILYIHIYERDNIIDKIKYLLEQQIIITTPLKIKTIRNQDDDNFIQNIFNTPIILMFKFIIVILTIISFFYHNYKLDILLFIIILILLTYSIFGLYYNYENKISYTISIIITVIYFIIFIVKIFLYSKNNGINISIAKYYTNIYLYSILITVSVLILLLVLRITNTYVTSKSLIYIMVTLIVFLSSIFYFTNIRELSNKKNTFISIQNENKLFKKIIEKEEKDKKQLELNTKKQILNNSKLLSEPSDILNTERNNNTNQDNTSKNRSTKKINNTYKANTNESSEDNIFEDEVKKDLFTKAPKIKSKNTLNNRVNDLLRNSSSRTSRTTRTSGTLGTPETSGNAGTSGNARSPETSGNTRTPENAGNTGTSGTPGTPETTDPPVNQRTLIRNNFEERIERENLERELTRNRKRRNELNLEQQSLNNENQKEQAKEYYQELFKSILNDLSKNPNQKQLKQIQKNINKFKKNVKDKTWRNKLVSIVIQKYPRYSKELNLF